MIINKKLRVRFVEHNTRERIGAGGIVFFFSTSNQYEEMKM